MHVDLLRSLYGGLSFVAVVLGFVLYRRDVEDDLSKTKPNDLPSSLLASQIFLVLLALSLVYGVWDIRHESLALILILPINAMWLWAAYIGNLSALAKRKGHSAQVPANT